MTCLLHIRTTTAASPNTKRKERSEDLEERNRGHSKILESEVKASGSGTVLEWAEKVGFVAKARKPPSAFQDSTSSSY